MNRTMKILDQSAFKTIHEPYTCRYLQDEQHFLEQVDHPYCTEACYVGAIAAVILLHILPVWLINKTSRTKDTLICKAVRPSPAVPGILCLETGENHANIPSSIGRSNDRSKTCYSLYHNVQSPLGRTELASRFTSSSPSPVTCYHPGRPKRITDPLTARRLVTAVTQNAKRRFVRELLANTNTLLMFEPGILISFLLQLSLPFGLDQV